MNCNENSKFSAFWEYIKKFPSLRYLKAPAFNVQQLYERYPDGLETGAFTFVIEKWAFYAWDFKTKEWKLVSAISLDDITWENIKGRPDIPDEQIQSDWSQEDELKKDFIKNKPEEFSPSDHDHSGEKGSGGQISYSNLTDVPDGYIIGNVGSSPVVKNIAIMNSIPSPPDENTIYFITGI